MSIQNIIKPSDAHLRFKGYQNILDNLSHLNPERYKKVKRILEIKIKGARGEKQTSYHLNFLPFPEEHFILHNLKLKIGQQTAQIDHVVVSTKGIFLIETKNWYSETQVEEDYNWSVKKGGKFSGIQSPHDQLRRHKEVIQGSKDFHHLKHLLTNLF